MEDQEHSLDRSRRRTWRCAAGQARLRRRARRSQGGEGVGLRRRFTTLCIAVLEYSSAPVSFLGCFDVPRIAARQQLRSACIAT